MPSALRLCCLFGLGLATATVSATPQAIPQARDQRPGVQPADPVGTATIQGVVTMASTGGPARKVRVSLGGSELRRGNRTSTTDDQGRFSFTALPAGRYTLTASRPGHNSVTYGQRMPGRPGTAIQLTDGQIFRANMQIPKGGVITGLILDENGEPAMQTPVRLMRVVTSGGQRRLQGSSSATTDDRGIYRVFGLLPGEYVACALPRNTAASDLDRLRSEMQGLEQALESMAARGTQEQTQALRERMTFLQNEVADAADDGPPPGYAPVCYPGSVSTGSATPIPLGVGEERVGVDLQLQLAPLARVEGSVINSTGAEVRAINVVLSELNPLGPSMANITARVDGQGQFRLPNVPPGQYRLTARTTTVPPRPAAAPAGGRGAAPPRPEPISLWGAADIVVDGRNLSNVMITLQQGVSVTGQVTFDGATPAPTDLTRVRVTMTPSEPNMGAGASARVEANGRFTIASVTPGRYRLTAGGASGWSAESAMIGGQDALDFPVEVKGNQPLGGATITFTDGQTEITGVVTNESNQPALDYTLVVFPADQRYWTGSTRRVQFARPSTDGRFTFRGLPPGEYRISSVLDLEPGATSDPAFLEQLANASMRVTLQRGEKKVQDMQLR